MSLLNKKMFMAPVLAVALAVLITGAIYYSPLPTTQSAPQVQVQVSAQPTQSPSEPAGIASTTTMPTPMPAPTTRPSLDDKNLTQEAPSAVPSTMPTSSGSQYFVTAQNSPSEASPVTALLFVLGAIAVAIVAAVVVFSERGLKKEQP